MAQNSGKIFEGDIKASIPKDVYYYRLRDSGSAFGTGNDNLRFSITNLYDCFLYKKPGFFPLELKTCQGTSFSIQHTKEEKGKDIKLHQIDGLSKASEFDGVFAGLLLNFRKSMSTYWINIKDFLKFNGTTEKKSINEQDVIDHNGIKVKSELKRTRHKFSIGELLEKIQEKQNEVIKDAN